MLACQCGERDFRLLGSLVACSVGLVGWSAGWLAGRLAGWLVGCLAGWLAALLTCCCWLVGLQLDADSVLLAAGAHGGPILHMQNMHVHMLVIFAYNTQGYVL